MTDKIMYWMSVLFGGLAVLMIVVNITIISGNRSLQTELNQRQVSIDTATRLTQLNQNLVQALAEASIKNDDKQIHDLLTSQGITFKENKDKEPAQAKKK